MWWCAHPVTAADVCRLLHRLSASSCKFYFTKYFSSLKQALYMGLYKYMTILHTGIYTYVFQDCANLFCTSRGFWNLQRNFVALNHISKSHLVDLSVFEQNICFCSSEQDHSQYCDFPHERLNVGGDWSLWGNLWHHSPGRSIGLSFAPGSCVGKHWMGVTKWSTMPALYFLDQWPCPSVISSGE